MPADSSEGRRAAQASAAPMENDQAERDASLKKVEARDLVEFGMIPVSNKKKIDSDHVRFVYEFESIGIRWTLPRAGSIP